MMLLSSLVVTNAIALQHRQRLKPIVSVRWRNIRWTTIALLLSASILPTTRNSNGFVKASTVNASIKNKSRRTTSLPTKNHHQHQKYQKHHHHEQCNGQPTIPTKRHACNLFLWDAPSALFYKWCRYLVKDHIYEGKGGYLFVRFESNSILQLLYPCTRYAPNRCFLCGGSFPDHLELWWSKKYLYTPFDQYLDRTYSDAMTRNEVTTKQKKTTKSGYSSTSSLSYSKKNKMLPKSAEIVQSPPTFAFHRRYVEDISHLAGISDVHQRRRKVMEWLEQKKQQVAMNHATNTKNNGHNEETHFTFGSCADVQYVTMTTVKKATTNGNHNDNNNNNNNITNNNISRGLQNSITDWLSFVIMNTVNEIIRIQSIENNQLQMAAEAKSPY